MDHEKKLVDEGYLTTDGQVNTTRINLLTGTITMPFFDNATSIADDETMLQLYSFMMLLYKLGHDDYAMETFSLAYSLVGMDFNDSLMAIGRHKQARRYFLKQFLLDLDDLLSE